MCLFVGFFNGMAAGTESDPAAPILNIDQKLTSQEQDWLNKKPVIQVAGPRSFPPFHYYEKNGRLKGISADYLFLIMENLGIQIKIQKAIPWSEVLKRAENGQVDMIPCIAKNSEREIYLNFSTPYLSFPLVILSRKDASFIGGINDLYGARLAVVKKIVTSSWLKQDGIEYIPYIVDTPLEALKAVAFGQADVAIENLATAGYLMQQHGITNIKIAAPTPYGNYTLHMAVRKELPELLSLINKALEEITPQKHSRIKNKWLSIRYEHGIRKKDVVKWGVAIFLLSGIIAGLSIAWSRRIKHESMNLKKAEEKLEAGEKRFKVFFNSMSDALFLHPLKEIGFAPFVDVNETACELYGYTLDEFKTLTAFDITQKEDARSHARADSRKKLLEKGCLIFESIHIKKSGEQFPVEIHSNIIELEGQNMILAVVRDVSERKTAEQETIIAQKIIGEQEKMALVGQVAGKMAHDFNNILGAVLGNAELSLLNCTDKEIRQRLKIILSQTERGRNLTKNLVVFAKDQEIKEAYFNLNDKIDLVLNLLQKELDGISVAKEYCLDLPQLLADPGMIEHALVNIIQNSVHALSKTDTPQLIVRTYAKDKQIFLEIEDNGCGIAKEHLEEIYMPAFTLKGEKDENNAYRKGINGTGYGMANVKNYIEKHKGTIDIESYVDKGTRLIISLPVILKELSRTEKQKIVTNPDLIQGKRILLVEDEQAISNVQYAILTAEPFSHEVIVANNGQIAVDSIRRDAFDLISLDYILPGKVNGMDVYHTIREINKEVPIIFVSGNITFIESIKNLKNNDPNIDLLSKPFQNIEYVNKINEWLNLR